MSEKVSELSKKKCPRCKVIRLHSDFGIKRLDIEFKTCIKCRESNKAANKKWRDTHKHEEEYKNKECDRNKQQWQDKLEKIKEEDAKEYERLVDVRKRRLEALECLKTKDPKGYEKLISLGKFKF